VAGPPGAARAPGRGCGTPEAVAAMQRRPGPCARRRGGPTALLGVRCSARSAARRRRHPRRPPSRPQVRVWWPPTGADAASAGAYWPAMVVGRGRSGFLLVRYDNGDEEEVAAGHVSPAEAPLEFGEEPDELQVRAGAVAGGGRQRGGAEARGAGPVPAGPTPPPPAAARLASLWRSPTAAAPTPARGSAASSA
jgi:hypothetical protein